MDYIGYLRLGDKKVNNRGIELCFFFSLFYRIGIILELNDSFLIYLKCVFSSRGYLLDFFV